MLKIASCVQSVFQEVAKNPVLQYNEVHVWHADDEQGKSQHAFFISSEIGYVWLHGKASDAG